MKLNGIKALQRKAIAAAATVVPNGWTGQRVTEWMVVCSGGCGTGEGWHYVRRRNGNGFVCNCPAGANRHACYHILAVWRDEVTRKGRIPSFWANRAVAKQTKRHPIMFVANGVKVFATLRK